MKRTTKYGALDVHQVTTLASVRDEASRVITRAIVPTEELPIGEFIRMRSMPMRRRSCCAVGRCAGTGTRLCL
jgi:hypothetical protein